MDIVDLSHNSIISLDGIIYLDGIFALDVIFQLDAIITLDAFDIPASAPSRYETGDEPIEVWPIW